MSVTRYLILNLKFVQVLIAIAWHPVLVGAPLRLKQAKQGSVEAEKDFVQISDIFGSGLARELHSARSRALEKQRVSVVQNDGIHFDSDHGGSPQEDRRPGFQEDEIERRILERLTGQRAELQEILEEKEQDLRDIKKGKWHFRRGPGYGSTIGAGFQDPDDEVDARRPRQSEGFFAFDPEWDMTSSPRRTFLSLLFFACVYVCCCYVFFHLCWDAGLFEKPLRWVKRNVYTDLWVSRDPQSGGIWLTTKQRGTPSGMSLVNPLDVSRTGYDDPPFSRNRFIP